MEITQFYLPGNYDSPLTATGRARTIAAFHLAQGDVDVLTNSAMRRDVLTALMSASAVTYWLHDARAWLERSQKVGRVQLLRLSDAGLNTCSNSVQGGSNVPTTRGLVLEWRRKLLLGGAGFNAKSFSPLSTSPEA